MLVGLIQEVEKTQNQLNRGVRMTRCFLSIRDGQTSVEKWTDAGLNIRSTQQHAQGLTNLHAITMSNYTDFYNNKKC